MIVLVPITVGVDTGFLWVYIRWKPMEEERLVMKAFLAVPAVWAALIALSTPASAAAE